MVMSHLPVNFLNRRVLTPSVTRGPRIRRYWPIEHRRVGREQVDLHIVEVEAAAALRRPAIVADIMVERALPAGLELAA